VNYPSPPKNDLSVIEVLHDNLSYFNFFHMSNIFQNIDLALQNPKKKSGLQEMIILILNLNILQYISMPESLLHKILMAKPFNHEIQNVTTLQSVPSERIHLQNLIPFVALSE